VTVSLALDPRLLTLNAIERHFVEREQAAVQEYVLPHPADRSMSPQFSIIVNGIGPLCGPAADVAPFHVVMIWATDAG